MRIQFLHVVNTVSLHGWFPTLWRWKRTSKTTGTASKVAWHHIPEHSNSHCITFSEHNGIHFHKSGINLLKKFLQ